MKQTPAHDNYNPDVLRLMPKGLQRVVEVGCSSGDQGLLDRTHLRWFTRITIVELFQSTGYQIAGALSRIFEEPARQNVLPSIRAMAVATGMDPATAENDSLALQYVIKATPA